MPRVYFYLPHPLTHPTPPGHVGPDFAVPKSERTFDTPLTTSPMGYPYSAQLPLSDPRSWLGLGLG